ncbi:MAG: rRNA pseudouridine synthase [Candidatus Gracilibacteria bacterium]|jgi:23S rRNA pseudouridine2605 synthase/23S rRNA pseudouridine2604 synthase|nr:rRNA pseudouridine synthase [Candidatus Gracilibacteria bacterium]
MEIRLNKYLSEQGICSRREAEKLITEGAIKINGKITQEQGIKIDPEKDKLEISESALQKKSEEKVVYALNKPIGYVSSTHATSVEKNIVTDLLKVPERIYPIGRLDKDTSGLLLMTNDGDICYKLTHPKFSHKKIYLVETYKEVSDEALDKLRKGVTLFGEKTLPTKIEKISSHRFKITLKEGKNRQIRRIFRKIGSNVKRLKRIQIGELELKSLDIDTGKYVKLKQDQIKLLTK